jgi:hypothetical protein
MPQRNPLVISCLIALGYLAISTPADAQHLDNRSDTYVRGRLVQLPATRVAQPSTRVAQAQPTEIYPYPAPGDSSASREAYSGPDGGVIYAEPALPAEPTFTPFAPFGQSNPPCAQPGLLTGISLFREFLFRARRCRRALCGAQDGILFPGTTPMGPVAVANLGYQPGFRVGRGLQDRAMRRRRPRTPGFTVVRTTVSRPPRRW